MRERRWAHEQASRFWDRAGFGNHCWECGNSADWSGEKGRCSVYRIAVTKYDSPNNICSVGRKCFAAR